MTRPEASPQMRFVRELHRARTLRDLFQITLAEVQRALGYQTIWFGLRDAPDSAVLRIVDVMGAQGEWFHDQCPTVPVTGDAMLEELFASNRILVVEDARTDPRTNKQLVELMQNRTIINAPLAMFDKPFGALGMGTFGAEECRVPTPEQLAYLEDMTSSISVAISRVELDARMRQTERERRELDGKLARMQRLDTVGVLAGGIAHDFNNLLTVLLAATSLARSASSPAEITRELNAIDEVAERAQALTRQLLAMSRRQALELQDLALGPLLTDFVPFLRRVIPASVHIELLSSLHEVYVEADKTQLEQVVMNLCLNARDAMPDGGRITIETEIVLVNGAYRETHPWAKPGRYVLLSVSDTGQGIHSEHLDRIFDPFFTTKGEHAGTGLGLSVTHGIVQQHGGMLHCYSEVGIGTTFKIYLPLLARTARAVGTKIEPRVQGGHERILVGEDDPAVRGIVRRILERSGYEVAMMPSGLEVIRLLQSEKFDLLLLDVVMPGIPCAEVVERVRALHPTLPILLASGYTADAPIAALLREHRVPLLPKPYDPDTLLRTIRATLGASTGVT